jgi:hypothetical protein
VSAATILLIIVILMLIGVFPAWRHSQSWGFRPAGGFGLVATILIVLLLFRLI